MPCAAQAHPIPRYRGSQCAVESFKATNNGVCITSDPAGLSAPRITLSEKLLGLASQTAVSEAAALTCAAQAHPVPAHSEKLDLSGAAAGRTATLSCQAQAYPTPEYR
ncbi:hypothetical protein E2C01_098176 [Portunus trituberculatus]|uniref:Uncharacterized protein n=1 Tax=Portunus trituberculatus TaxID=210409 RepID=A0A5B7K7J8_PORTR|nr:hypothetical protein [Portunus trituberculatus]